MFDTLDRSIRNPRSKWTAAMSFVLQTAGVGVLLLIPLLYTEALPVIRNDGGLPPPPRRAEFANQNITQVVSTRRESRSEIFHGQIMAPARIPPVINRVVDVLDQPSGEMVPNAVAGGTGDSRETGAFLKSLLTEPPRPAPAPSSAGPRTVRVSHLDQGMLIKRVDPVYPGRARLTRTQGAVRLHAVVDRNGEVTELNVISGHPFLVAAAIDAVRQWRYRPYLLNGEPVSVDTEITVNFVLGQ